MSGRWTSSVISPPRVHHVASGRHARIASGGYADARSAAEGQRGGTTIGAVLFHGISDRDTAAAQIDTQMIAIVSAVLSAAGADPGLVRWREKHADAYKELDKQGAQLAALEKQLQLTPWDWMTKQSIESLKKQWPREVSDFLERIIVSRDAIDKSPYRALWDDAVSPTFNEWNDFYKHRLHWYDATTAITTSWEDYLAWAKRVNDLRNRVEAAGIAIALPRMPEFAHSLQEHAEDVAQSAKQGVGDLFQILKYGLYAALGIGAVAATASIVSNVRERRDPIESWARLRRGG